MVLRFTLLILLAQPLTQALEIWGSGEGWTGWDLAALNGTGSLIFSGMPVELAHKHGIRSLTTTCSPSVSDMASEASRVAFAASCASSVKSDGTDGANFDFEDPIPFGSPLVRNYTLTVAATTAALKKASLRRATPLQVVVDIAWGPFGIDGRFYDAKGLADASDRLFVMAYDMQSQIYGRCVAQANSPYQQVKRGLEQFLQLGIPPEKLVLGLPWYGYSYPCVNSDVNTDKTDVCEIPETPWRGINCSDAVGVQLPYSKIMSILDNQINVTEVKWDDNQLSPYFNHRVGHQLHQVWFEDPKSLAKKYSLAREFGIAGVGIWELDDVGALPDAHARAMWDALVQYALN